MFHFLIINKIIEYKILITRTKAVIEVSITFMIDKSSWNLNFTKFNIDQYTVASWISFHTVGEIVLNVNIAFLLIQLCFTLKQCNIKLVSLSLKADKHTVNPFLYHQH